MLYVCVTCPFLFLCVCVYQEFCLTLNALTFSVTMFNELLYYNIPYMS